MTALLAMRGIHKTFPGTRALAGIDFDVEAGEVHALVGENGAGKSTLMHILAGVHQPDAGTICFNGQANVHISDESEAQQLGIAIVYQERSLFNLLSVAENIFVNSQPVNRWGVVNRAKLRRMAKELLDRLRLKVHPETPLGRLAPAHQQMVEIAKALSIDARLILFDEPTTALTQAETGVLFELIRQLKNTGVGIVYISHRLEEIFHVADRVTVLKDGEVQGTFPIDAISPDDLVMRMVGRGLGEPIEQTRSTDREANEKVALEVRDGGRAFSVRRGEILVFCGLTGAGRTTLAQAIFGARPFSGTILVSGQPVRIESPADAIAADIGYLPEDRKEMGLFLEMSVAQNIAAARLSYFGCWWMRDSKLVAIANRFSAKLCITPPGIQREAKKLSGGNQQKVMLARWLLCDPAILIIDEPTRGIDVAAKEEIYSLLREAASNGKAVIVISSHLPEALAIADRILVMRHHRIVGELTRPEASEERIMRLAAL